MKYDVRSLSLCAAFLVFLSFPLPAFADVQSCGVPDEVTVDNVHEDYCDIYQRQIAYKTTAKKTRESLEQRRNSYEADHFSALEKYRTDMEEIYAKESQEFQEAIAGQDDASAKKKKIENEKSQDDPKAEEGEASPSASSESTEVQDTASVDTVSSSPEMAEGDGVGIKEKVYEPDETPDGEVIKKRVVMPEDAPDFDTDPF